VPAAGRGLRTATSKFGDDAKLQRRLRFRLQLQPARYRLIYSIPVFKRGRNLGCLARCGGILGALHQLLVKFHRDRQIAQLVGFLRALAKLLDRRIRIRFEFWRRIARRGTGSQKQHGGRNRHLDLADRCEENGGFV
jgi:hypothetical protein